LTKTRRTIQKDANQAAKEMLKGCRWLLIKNRENLSEGLQKSTCISEASPELNSFYKLREFSVGWSKSGTTLMDATTMALQKE